jgi:small conductance mechanosensitive channel
MVSHVQKHQAHRRYRRYRRYRWILGLAALGLLLALAWGWGSSPSWAQAETGPPGFAELEELTPPEVQSLFPNTNNNLAQAPVHLDGRTVFQVAVPADRPTGLTASERAKEIERRLYRIAQQVQAQDGQFDITREHDTQSNQPIIFVNGEVVMTVTSLDAELAGTGSLTFRAIEMSQDIQRALDRYLEERQGDFLWQQTRWALALVLGLGLASFAILQGQRYLNHHRHCRLDQHPETPTAEPSTALRHTLLNRREERVYRFQLLLLRLLQGGIGLGGGFVLLGLFPQSRWLQPFLIALLRLPLRFLMIILIAYGLIRLSEEWLERLFLAMQERAGLTQERSQRLALRLSTFSEVVKGIVAVAIGLVATLTLLSQVGVQVGPLIAGAGILGIAISLASQSLIKDIINGFLILVEDQYGVGDVIIVGQVAGFVETMNLRITQLRNEEGRLITIPNGQINVVENLSKEWSRVDLMIPVGLAADIDQALALVERTAHTLSQDGIWGSLILEPPLLLGVDQLDHVGATVRIWIKTQPLKQWDVAREYRRRLKIAFEQAGIPIGVPQQRITVTPSALDGPLSPTDPLPSAPASPTTAINTAITGPNVAASPRSGAP